MNRFKYQLASQRYNQNIKLQYNECIKQKKSTQSMPSFKSKASIDPQPTILIVGNRMSSGININGFNRFPYNPSKQLFYNS